MEWRRSGEYEDVRYETSEGIAKITIDRPEVRNAFRPTTVRELSQAFEVARDEIRRVDVESLPSLGYPAVGARLDHLADLLLAHLSGDRVDG